jgi:hypothetical protein
MSGCGCGQPVILANPAAQARVDVETQLMCDVLSDGAVAATVMLEPVYDTGTGLRVGIRTVDPVTGDDYEVQGELLPCETSRCASPTTPTATVGLCLADGTPIAVTVIRDCLGATLSEGWLNLTTGAWSTGAPPAGTVACGDSQSIQVSGTFCDIDPATGEVLGLVLVEYQYAADGSISGVRLVDAVTGATYTPQGDVSVCPAGVEQPEQDLTLLCDTAGDGTVTPFVRDYRRDENGTIVGHSDYTLDHAPYLPTGTVGMCGSCTHCETATLCDTTPGPAQWYALADHPDGSLPNGRTVTTAGLTGEVTGQPGIHAIAPAPPGAVLTADAPVQARWVASLNAGAILQLPAGTVLHELHPLHSWDAATAQLTGGAGATTSPGPTQYSRFSHPALTDLTITQIAGPPVAFAGAFDFALPAPVPFLRTTCRDCDGAVVSVTDTELDGATPYVPTGTVGVCLPLEDPERTMVCYSASGLGDTCGAGQLQEQPTLSPTIASALVEANPGAFTVNGLEAGYDGQLTTWTTTTLDDTGAAPGLVLRYTFAGAADIAQVELENNYGGIVNDGDGIGAATLSVYDAGGVQLWQGPLVAGNGGAIYATTFDGAVLRGASSFTLSDIVRQPSRTVTQIGWREIRAVGSYRALITWDCPNETIQARVEGLRPGIAYDGMMLDQTGGPHTFTFSSSVGAFDATLETDNPSAWSSTAVSDTAPQTVLSGDATLTLNVVASAQAQVRSGWLNEDGTVTDANTGEEVPDPQIVPCVAPREPDHVIGLDVVAMCDGTTGTTFLRHIEVTRDGNELILDTGMDGRTPYAAADPSAVTVGACRRERLGEVCAEMGPLMQPSALTGFVQEAACLVTQGQANPTATYTGVIGSIEFTEDAGPAGAASFRLLLNGADQLLASAFTPPIPAFPTATSAYTGTATLAGITVTAEITGGALARNGTAFGLAGRMRFTFSEPLSSLTVQTAAWGDDPGNRLCDVVVLPSADPDPQRLTTFLEPDGTTTYYGPDGRRVTAPVLVPTSVCTASPCQDCETLLLCDSGADGPATITGLGVSSGTLSNGVVWAVRGNTTTGTPSKRSNADGAWFGKPESFPTVSVPPYTLTLDRPSTVEFSVYMAYSAGATDPDFNCTQLPPGVEAVALPAGFVYDPLTNRVCVTAGQTSDPCPDLTEPNAAASARFRTNGPVTSLTTRFLGGRYARCGQFQSSWVGAFEVAPSGQFLRRICRDCTGEVSLVTDTELDAVTPYTPIGAVRQCAQTPRCDTTVMGECVYSLPDISNGFALESTAFPDCWLGTATNPTYTYGDRVASWEGTYQSSTGTLSGVGFSSPDLGGVVSLAAFTPALPANPEQSATDYVGTATINGITLTLRSLAGDGLSLQPDNTQLALNPGDRAGIEFSRPVRLTVLTGAFADPPTPHNERLCGVAAATVPWDALKLADCEGHVTTVDATTRQPLPERATVTCDDDCCHPVQVCVAGTRTESLEFISNAANAVDNTVDPTWTWSPALAGPWYDMYRTPPVGGWITQDGGTPGGTAHWVAAHPNGSPVQSNPPRPGEGPTIGVQTWYARASFNLPEGADPASIRIASTVLNADQNLVQWRLNTGAWQPVNRNHTQPPFVFGPTAVPGVQPGTNEMILQIDETVAGGGGAALMVHLIASYQLPETGQRSWTRMVCCHDTVYYLDEMGDRQDALPEFWQIAPCGGGELLVLCDDSGPFLRHIGYAAGQVLMTDTTLAGAPYVPVGAVHTCP